MYVCNDSFLQEWLHCIVLHDKGACKYKSLEYGGMLFFGIYRRCRSRSDCVRQKPVKLNFRLTRLIDLDGKKSHPAVICLFISVYLPSLPVAHLSDAPRRRLVVTGDNTRIQDETTESSAWSFNVLGV